MRHARNFAAVAATLALAATAGCGRGPGFVPVQPPPAHYGPVVPVYAMGDVIGGRSARERKARAAGSRPLTPPEVLDYLQRQEADLRRQTAGTGVDVIRSGEIILVRMPAALTFASGSADISAQAVSTLGEIGLTLKSYNRSLVDVLGHTDSTGTAAANQALSERRASAVAARLRSRGVAAGRIATKGFGADHPISDNSTEDGRALNRRVEIKIVPVRG